MFFNTLNSAAASSTWLPWFEFPPTDEGTHSCYPATNLQISSELANPGFHVGEAHDSDKNLDCGIQQRIAAREIVPGAASNPRISSDFCGSRIVVGCETYVGWRREWLHGQMVKWDKHDNVKCDSKKFAVICLSMHNDFTPYRCRSNWKLICCQSAVMTCLI
jgi:hypothetical protein